MSFVITSGILSDVENEVSNLLRLGFNLHGSMISHFVNGSVVFFQSVHHSVPNLIRNMELNFISNGQTATHRVFVVYNSEKLEELLNSIEKLKTQDRTRWMHCRLVSDPSKDVFVKDEKYACNEFNIEQGYRLGDIEEASIEGGRRHRTSRRKY